MAYSCCKNWIIVFNINKFHKMNFCNNNSQKEKMIENFMNWGIAHTNSKITVKL